MASIAMRAVMSAASELASIDPPFKHQQIQQFVTGALVGNGVNSFEAMIALGIPVVVDPALTSLQDRALGKWTCDLRADVVGARVDDAVRRIYKKQGKPMPAPDSIPFQFLKMRVGDIVATHIRKHGLRVYNHKLLFSPDFAEIGMAVLKEMKQPEKEIAPLTASSAVANGLLPTLPSRNLKEHLRFLNSVRMGGWGEPGKSFALWVSEATPKLVEFPAPNLKQGKWARVDSYRADPYSCSAELGMGFFLATTHNQVGERMAILTPMLSNKRRTGLPPQSWKAHFLSDQEHLRFMNPDDRKRLKDALEDSGSQSVLLKVCPTCNEIYSDDRDELKLRCNCARSS